LAAEQCPVRGALSPRDYTEHNERSNADDPAGDTIRFHRCLFQRQDAIPQRGEAARTCKEKSLVSLRPCVFALILGSGKVLTDEPVTPVGPWADLQRIALKTLAFAGLVPTATAVGVERISQM
jgi:hypothetical protein